MVQRRRITCLSLRHTSQIQKQVLTHSEESSTANSWNWCKSLMRDICTANHIRFSMLCCTKILERVSSQPEKHYRGIVGTFLFSCTGCLGGPPRASICALAPAHKVGTEPPISSTAARGLQLIHSRCRKTSVSALQFIYFYTPWSCQHAGFSVPASRWSGKQWAQNLLPGRRIFAWKNGSDFDRACTHQLGPEQHSPWHQQPLLSNFRGFLAFIFTPCPGLHQAVFSFLYGLTKIKTRWGCLPHVSRCNFGRIPWTQCCREQGRASSSIS